MTDLASPLTIGPLAPGLYVIETERDITDEVRAAFRRQLADLSPDHRFIVLAAGARIARLNEPPKNDQRTANFGDNDTRTPEDV